MGREYKPEKYKGETITFETGMREVYVEDRYGVNGNILEEGYYIEKRAVWAYWRDEEILTPTKAESFDLMKQEIDKSRMEGKV